MNVVSYVDVLNGSAKVGKNVAVIGAGGIGYDVSDFLTHDHTHGKCCVILCVSCAQANIVCSDIHILHVPCPCLLYVVACAAANSH